MHLVHTPPTVATGFATVEEVADVELTGSWVVDVRSEPRPPARSGWLVAWEDDIVFLMDPPRELDVPLDAA